MKLLLNEMIAEKAKKETVKELSELLWPKSNETTQYQNMRLLLNGKRTSISFDELNILCDYFKCTPSELLQL
jgi:DNA-binding Xre family transcriptional regulator